MVNPQGKKFKEEFAMRGNMGGSDPSSDPTATEDLLVTVPAGRTCALDCRSAEGQMVGCLDTIMLLAGMLRMQDLHWRFSGEHLREALKDLQEHEDVKWLMETKL